MAKHLDQGVGGWPVPVAKAWQAARAADDSSALDAVNRVVESGSGMHRAFFAIRKQAAEGAKCAEAAARK
eukprot:9070748-Alexandrium_andersonii.AAC.1